jgi:hypothetical protein
MRQNGCAESPQRKFNRRNAIQKQPSAQPQVEGTYVAKNVFSRQKSPATKRVAGGGWSAAKPQLSLGLLGLFPTAYSLQPTAAPMAIFTETRGKWPLPRHTHDGHLWARKGRLSENGYRENIHPIMSEAVPRLPDSNPSKLIQSLATSPSSVHCTLPPIQSRLSSITSVPT